MKISSYDVSQESSRSFSHMQEIFTEIKSVFFQGPSQEESPQKTDQAEISSLAKEKYFSSKSASVDKTTDIRKINQESPEEQKEKEFIGKIVSHVSNMDVNVTEKTSFVNASSANIPAQGVEVAEDGDVNSLKVSFSQSVKSETKESTSVATQGKVLTEDGREISFAMHLNMERRLAFETEFDGEVSLSKLIDPLVVQFEDGPPSLSDKYFDFDLNNDGRDEKLNSLGKGSGFLAFDINNDGKINNGSELFGTKTGNGFQELAAYDEDGNGWIDENDSVYEKLSVWRPETEGESEYLNSLSAADVGAVYLGSDESGHTLIDDTGNTLAQLKSTGMFLKDSGGAGHVYQMDLADLNSSDNNEQQKNIESQQENEPSTGSLDFEKPDFFASIRKKIEEFRDSMDTGNNNSEADNAKSVFDKMKEDIKRRIDNLLELLEGKDSKGIKSVNPYEKNENTGLNRINMDV